MSQTLATLLTITTYGTWLRGDARGWVDDGIVFPFDPSLEAADSNRMKHTPFYFDRRDLHGVGEAIGKSLIQRKKVRVLALTVQRWHSHIIFGPTRHHVSDIAKCVKDAVRWHLRVGRPIWATDYDKRWCFDLSSVTNRVRYVERHNLQNGWDARPWEFIDDWEPNARDARRVFTPG